ncbi:MAG: molybdopterin-guanine dinucleotide biosynthesis protein A [Alphaproteobacteria bacterium]
MRYQGRASACGAVLALVTMLATSLTSATEDRHAGYYYPPPASTEVYRARTMTLANVNRETRLGFVAGLTQQMLSRSYPPQYVIFAKGDEAEKLIIVSLYDDHLDTVYRARALFAMLTSVARLTRFLTELGVADFFTFFDLAKLLGFTRITISDGDAFAHQVIIE